MKHLHYITCAASQTAWKKGKKEKRKEGKKASKEGGREEGRKADDKQMTNNLDKKRS